MRAFEGMRKFNIECVSCQMWSNNYYNERLVVDTKTDSDSENECQPLIISQASASAITPREDSATDCEKLKDDEIHSTQDMANTDLEKPPKIQKTYRSIVTIFAIWNTTVSTSLLAMASGIEKTGLFPAILINLLFAAISLYTSSTILEMNEKYSIFGQSNEVGDLCRALIGRWAEIIARIFSMVVLIGANIVYWLLMSNYFYDSGNFLFWGSDSNDTGILCPKNQTVGMSVTDVKYHGYWDLYSSVPCFLGLLMFPMLNWKSLSFFTIFNSLGTISLCYLIVFVAIKAYTWGIHMSDWTFEFKLKPTFCSLGEMLSLSYFIHNIVISVMKNNRQQEKNGRDLSIAFGLVTFTYLFIGVFFYITFPLPKFCIEDNLLNNFTKSDPLTIVARILLLFQLFTVFPLISYMLRNDILTNLNMVWKKFSDFSYLHVVTINILIVAVCILCACFLPHIRTLIRYTDALGGTMYIFMLPSILKIASLKKERRLTMASLVFHLDVIVFGGFNLLLQFFINDY